MSGSIYQNEWASIARMRIALERDLRTTLFPREVGVVDGFIRSNRIDRFRFRLPVVAFREMRYFYA